MRGEKPLAVFFISRIIVVIGMLAQVVIAPDHFVREIRKTDSGDPWVCLAVRLPQTSIVQGGFDRRGHVKPERAASRSSASRTTSARPARRRRGIFHPEMPFA